MWPGEENLSYGHLRRFMNDYYAEMDSLFTANCCTIYKVTDFLPCNALSWSQTGASERPLGCEMLINKSSSSSIYQSPSVWTTDDEE